MRSKNGRKRWQMNLFRTFDQCIVSSREVTNGYPMNMSAPRLEVSQEMTPLPNVPQVFKTPRPCHHEDCKVDRIPAAYLKYEAFQNPTLNDPSSRYFDGRPGFLDPLAVVQVCIPILNSYIHKPRRPCKWGDGKEAQYCEGIKVYLEKWDPDESVELAVQSYIKFPCIMELRAAVRGSYVRALQFLLSYLRARGPFMEWEVRPGNDKVMARCINTVLDGILRRLSDLEYTAAVIIGRYLHYLNTIAYSHQIYFFRVILAKVWGPIFIRPVFSSIYNTFIPPSNEKERVELGIAIFAKVLDCANWQIYEPFEGMQKVIREEQMAPIQSRQPDSHDPENTYTTIPKILAGTMSDTLKDESIQKAIESAKPTCPIHSLQSRTTSDFRPRAQSIFPPDHCRLR
ncbi:hypothetical protein CSKR_101274 [Clonorchis sinensis]|uniref:Uncharacterized protein n=1 Tax=Clonorchis sinensis TaxID=79923 RepID=A0A8T1LWJ3_CLOSI|nr:hypothetical protein CSKR_101274 [Clonorchis sinensis]